MCRAEQELMEGHGARLFRTLTLCTRLRRAQRAAAHQSVISYHTAAHLHLSSLSFAYLSTVAE